MTYASCMQVTSVLTALLEHRNKATVCNALMTVKQDAFGAGHGGLIRYLFVCGQSEADGVLIEVHPLAVLRLRGAGACLDGPRLDGNHPVPTQQNSKPAAELQWGTRITKQYMKLPATACWNVLLRGASRCQSAPVPAHGSSSAGPHEAGQADARLADASSEPFSARTTARRSSSSSAGLASCACKAGRSAWQKHAAGQHFGREKHADGDVSEIASCAATQDTCICHGIHAFHAGCKWINKAFPGVSRPQTGRAAWAAWVVGDARAERTSSPFLSLEIVASSRRFACAPQWTHERLASCCCGVCQARLAPSNMGCNASGLHSSLSSP